MHKTLLITTSDDQQIVHLTIPPSKKENRCGNCQLTKPIYLITHQPGASYQKSYCWACALQAVYELEQGDYKVVNKSQIIKELRTALYQSDSEVTYERTT